MSDPAGDAKTTDGGRGAPSRLMVTPCRYDGSPKFRYPVDALALDDRRWVVHGVFGPEIGSHSGRLGFYPGDHTIEFYLVETWWNAYAVFSPAGAPRGYYCNIATPPRREADAIVYTDLDLDLLVRPDGSAVVLDRDEYEERAARFGYPADLRRQVDAALAEVTALAERRADLFDGGEAAVFFRRAVAMGGARA